jgi:AraC family transcriptional regulator of adaptative response/methylated-DNA-[protein]-cysteine methyltransferase
MGSLIAAPPLVLTRLDTPLGDMVAVTDGTTAASDALARELAEYFAGARTTFAARIVQRGTPFSSAVWRALCEIPCGETRSYGGLAARLGRPSAVRAVARANGANQVAILVPCHRVIGADGTLVGYGGKLWRKQWLLDHERKTARLF